MTDLVELAKKSGSTDESLPAVPLEVLVAASRIAACANSAMFAEYIRHCYTCPTAMEGSQKRVVRLQQKLQN